MLKVTKPAIITMLILAAVAAVYFLLFRAEAPPDFLEATGVIEATEAELSPKVAGRIVWLCCKEGDTIPKGAVAVRLDSTELQARVDEGRAAAASGADAITEAKLAIENSKVQREAAASEAEAARSAVDRSRALTAEAKANLDRAEGLFKGGYVTRRDLDSARAAYDSNLAELNSAQARQRSAEANVRNSSVNIRSAQARLATAGSRLKESEAQLRVTEAQLGDTEVFAPFSGVISYKSFEAGEYVNPGASVYTMYDPRDLWARVDIEETKIHSIALGSKAELTPSGAVKAISGKVIEIGEVGGFATQRDVTRGRADIKTFRVKIGVEDQQGLLKPGMTVQARIRFSPQH